MFDIPYLNNLFNSSPDIRQAWETKKNGLRFIIIVIFVFVNLLGLEMAAAGTSLITDILSTIDGYTQLLSDFVEIFKSPLQKFGYDYSGLLDAISSSVKLTIGCFFVTIAFHLLYHKDPFSNLELLRNLPYKDNSKFKIYLRELEFYAKLLPSNILAEKCNECQDYNRCPQFIPIEGEAKNRAWCQIFPKLKEEDIENWFKITYGCRKAYYLKYGFLFSAIFLTFIWGLVLILNATILETPANTKLLPYYLLVLYSLCFLFTWTHSLKEEKGGVWRKYKDRVESFFNRPDINSLINQLSDIGGGK